MKRINQPFSEVNTPEFFDNEFFRTYNNTKQVLNYEDKPRMEILSQKFKGGTFLDLGCGNSPLPVELQKQYPEAPIWAVDYSPRMVVFLLQRFPCIRYVCANALNLPFRDGYFEYIVAGELLEHFKEPEKLLKEIFRVMKPKGILALSTPYSEQNISHNLSQSHLWSFEEEDIQELLKPYGKVETFIFREENFPLIIAFCEKDEK